MQAPPNSDRPWGNSQRTNTHTKEPKSQPPNLKRLNHVSEGFGYSQGCASCTYNILRTIAILTHVHLNSQVRARQSLLSSPPSAPLLKVQTILRQCADTVRTPRLLYYLTFQKEVKNIAMSRNRPLLRPSEKLTI